MFRTILNCWIISVLITLPLMVHAADDSTSIGISVVIKASQQCDYNYSIENSSDMNTRNIQYSTCDVETSKLQHHLNQVAYSNLKTSTMQIDTDLYRVSMTVQ